MTKILFFTTAIEHSTFRKTAKMLRLEGAEVHIIGLTRNNFPVGDDTLSVESLGQIPHGNYFFRFLKLLKLMFFLRKRGKEYDIIYNFTLDTLLVAKLALVFNRKKWVYQIQDIRPIFFGKSIKNRLARVLERYLIAKVDVLVLSSPNYYFDYFNKVYDIHFNKVLIIENKIVPGTISPVLLQNDISQNSILTVGYFGMIRCSRSWEILMKFAAVQQGKFNLYIRGKSLSIPVEEDVKSLPNVRFNGVYRSPDDLNELYNQVDIVWACYPYNEDQLFGNWKMARTIRFYEACAFGKPVIVQKGTPQENDVLKYNIGIVIDMQNVDECIDILSSLTLEQLNLWKCNILKLDISYYYHDNEYKQLIDMLNK